MRKTIACCLIVKNEEALLERCLQSISGADSIWILDTGSTDSTISIARRYTENVFLDFVWTDSFQQAQNFLLEKVRGKSDFVLSIDADERLICPWSEVEKAVELATDVVRVTMVAEGATNEFGFGRLFRNCPEIYWVADIHKHLNVPGEGEPVGNVRIMYGYSPAHEKDPDRSLRMLERAVELGEGLPRNLYYLGREYWYKKRFQDCIDTFAKYLPIAHWPAELADAYLIMAQCYEAMRMADECGAACLQAILTNSNFKEAIEYMSTICLPENKAQWQRMGRAASNEGVLWKRVKAEQVNDCIAIFPHNDDESLFAAFSLLRDRPLVLIVTDSFIQPERGDHGCTAEIRRQETINAMAIAGCPVVFLGIKDTELTEEILRERLKGFNPHKVYAPAIQGGNLQHDIVGKVAKDLFGPRCVCYTTYTKTELHTTGTVEVTPTQAELDLKQKMLFCYSSQLRLPSTLPHFQAVHDKSEWLTSVYKKVLITPYFGKFPVWMVKFRVPDGYSWILDNNLDEFKDRVKTKLGIDYPGEPGTGKIWDYRGALGLLYEDEIKEYDFWGHADFDVVWGDVNKFVSDEDLSKLDLYSGHNEYVNGCFSLYRNCKEVNNLFQRYPHWREKLIHPEPNGWVEQEFSRTLERSGLRYAYTFNQGDPWQKEPKLKKEGNSLYQLINDNWVEIAFFHFRHSKIWPL